MGTDHLLELLFSHSLDGFFLMMLDEPVQWNDLADKERLLDYVFAHQRMTRVNDMLAQYGATREAFIGLTPADIYQHDIAHGREVRREFFGCGRLHIKTHERRLDGTPIDIEGDYICLYDEERRIIGHFGIQRDVTEEVRLQASVARQAAELETRVAERTAKLAHSESRIRAIVNVLPDVVFVLDDSGRYVEIVTQDDRRLYRNGAELLGRSVEDVLPEAAATSLREVTRQTTESGTVQVLEYPLDTQRGMRWFEGQGTQRRSRTEITEDGEQGIFLTAPLSFVVSVRDRLCALGFLCALVIAFQHRGPGRCARGAARPPRVPHDAQGLAAAREPADRQPHCSWRAGRACAPIRRSDPRCLRSRSARGRHSVQRAPRMAPASATGARRAAARSRTPGRGGGGLSRRSHSLPRERLVAVRPLAEPDRPATDGRGTPGASALR